MKPRPSSKAEKVASLALSRMTVERYIRLMAGFFVLASLGVGYWVHLGRYLFTAWVGLNLFQSAFTNWRPLTTILRKLGVGAVSTAG